MSSRSLLAQPGDVCTGLKIAFCAYSVGHHLHDRAAHDVGLWAVPGTCLEKIDGWLGK